MDVRPKTVTNTICLYTLRLQEPPRVSEQPSYSVLRTFDMIYTDHDFFFTYRILYKNEKLPFSLHLRIYTYYTLIESMFIL